ERRFVLVAAMLLCGTGDSPVQLRVSEFRRYLYPARFHDLAPDRIDNVPEVFPMRFAISFLISTSLMAPAYGQVFCLTRERMIKYTAKHPFDPFPVGRPKVVESAPDR